MHLLSEKNPNKQKTKLSMFNSPQQTLDSAHEAGESFYLSVPLIHHRQGGGDALIPSVDNF